jgi:hypothetical protein
MDFITLFFMVCIVFIGIYSKFTPLALIGVALILSYFWLSRKEPATPVPSGGLKVRPIIVQRAYKQESIYPRSMRMMVNPNWDVRPWFEQAAGAAGLMAGLTFQGGKTRQEP